MNFTTNFFKIFLMLTKPVHKWNWEFRTRATKKYAQLFLFTWWLILDFVFVFTLSARDEMWLDEKLHKFFLRCFWVKKRISFSIRCAKFIDYNANAFLSLHPKTRKLHRENFFSRQLLNLYVTESCLRENSFDCIKSSLGWFNGMWFDSLVSSVVSHRRLCCYKKLSTKATVKKFLIEKTCVEHFYNFHQQCAAQTKHERDSKFSILAGLGENTEKKSRCLCTPKIEQKGVREISVRA